VPETLKRQKTYSLLVATAVRPWQLILVSFPIDPRTGLETLASETYGQTALLRQVKGVGALTALAFVLTIADGTRFAKSRDIGAYGHL
jgi:hypothetical protein